MRGRSAHDSDPTPRPAGRDHEIVNPPGTKHQPNARELCVDPAWPAWLRSEFEAAKGNGRIGTELLSESERVRVWHISIAPGERLPVHRHVLDYFWTALTPGRSRSHYHDGRTMEAAYRPGDTVLAFTTVEFLDSANAPLDVR